MRLSRLLKDGISSLPWPLLTRLLALRNVIRAMPDPVLVYQMSKVGSSTVCESLDEKNISNIHVHYINRKSWKSASKMYLNNGKTLPPHFHTGRLLRQWLSLTERRVRVVTLVRDPIARYVSGAFEVGRLQGVPTGDVDASLRVLKDQLASPHALNYAYTWFDREIHPLFSVDILDHPFNREEGFGRITREDIDILILTLEQLDELVPTVLSDFVGQPLQLKPDRVRSDEIYAQVKERLQLRECTVRRLYDHEWMRHFYSAHDIKRFVHRWSKGTERRD